MPSFLEFLMGGLALVVLTGCTTPQAALDQARNTSALTASLAAEQREFRRVQTSVANSRIESIRRQAAALQEYESMAKFDDRMREAAGLSEDMKLYKSLRELSDSRAQDEVDLAAKLKGIDESLAGIVMPIPESASRVSALENTLLPLGEELSAEVRTKEAVKFAQTVRDGVEASRKKLREAEAATPKPPAQK